MLYFYHTVRVTWSPAFALAADIDAIEEKQASSATGDDDDDEGCVQ